MDVKTTCLGVLAWGEASGYEIRKHFEDGPFSHFAAAGYGSIYPALTKLTADGLVSCTEYAQDKRPDKKIYRITEAGLAALTTALQAPPAEDRYKSDLLFILFFAEFLPPAHLEALIDARIAFYREKIAQMSACKAEGADGAGPAHGADGAGADTDMLAHPAPGCGPISKGATGPSFVHGFGLAVYSAALDYLETNKAALVADVAARRAAAHGTDGGDDGESRSARTAAE